MHSRFRLLTVAGFAAALLPRLAQRGMFLDGVTYASIARNLAEGRGRFWDPFYTATIYPAFHEHPPLGFWLQSLWFRALGDHWFVERLYCAAVAVMIGLLIVVIWRSLYDTPDARDHEWLPVAFWIIVPVVSWTIVGNLLESTVALFAAAAVAAVVAGTKAPTAVAAFSAGAVSGLCVVGATLTKGPVGLFPLAAPVIVGLLPERQQRMLWCTAGQWATAGVCAALLLTASESRESLVRYVDQQVLAALGGRREVSGRPFAIVIELLQGVWLPMAVVAAIILAAARSWTAVSTRDRQVALAFTVLGLAGTLPILASPKQTGHYLMPAVAFYAIGAGALMLPAVAGLTLRLAHSRAATAVTVLAGALAVGTVVTMALRTLERDPARLAELDRLAPVAPRGATVGLCPAANGDWLLHAWFQRRFAISLDATTAAHEWFLKSGPDGPGCPPAACTPMSTISTAPDHAASLVLMRCR